MITSPMRWRIRSRVLLPVVCAPHSIQGHFPRHLSPTALDNPHAQIFCFLRNTRKNLNSHLCFPFTTNHLRTNGVHSVRGAEVSCERRGQHCSINRSQRNRALPCFLPAEDSSCSSADRPERETSKSCDIAPRQSARKLFFSIHKHLRINGASSTCSSLPFTNICSAKQSSPPLLPSTVHTRSLPAEDSSCNSADRPERGTSESCDCEMAPRQSARTNPKSQLFFPSTNTSG
jgi:hypothetical protein